MERYLSEHDPWQRFLITAKDNERDSTKGGIHVFTKDVDKFVKMIEDHGWSKDHGQFEYHRKQRGSC